MDQNAINEQEWRNPENWSGWLGTYSSARDVRVWVPKRTPSLGWTVNTGHPAGKATLVALIAGSCAIVLGTLMFIWLQQR